MSALLRLYETTPVGSSHVPLELELHDSQFRQLDALAKRNGVSAAQMAEEIINAFLLADTGAAAHD